MHHAFLLKLMLFDHLNSVSSRAVKQLNPSATSSCSGQTVWSWSTASAIAPALRWSGNRCSSSGRLGSCPHLPRSSSWGTSEICCFREPCRAKRADCSPSRQTAASSRSRRLKPTTVWCWFFTKSWTSSRSPKHLKRGWSESRV